MLRDGELPEGRAEDVAEETVVGRGPDMVRGADERLEDGSGLLGRLQRQTPGRAEHELGEFGVLVGERAILRGSG